MNRTFAFMIYGANGYTGLLAARRAKAAGLSPVLAGRNRDSVEALGRELGLPTRVVDLSNHDALVSSLREVQAVLHCAGPFSATARPMLEACIEARTHYLDITGELDVFESVYAAHERLVQAGIAAIPGVGFDVVPTDCLAVQLKEALPQADTLRLAWRSSHGKLSPGTAKTMVESLPYGARVRRDGVLVTVSPGSLVRRFPFREGREDSAVVLSLGDVSSAYRSTGIRNIECFIGLPARQVKSMRFGPWVQKALQRAPVQRVLKRAVERFVKGPSEAVRRQAHMELVGEVSAGDERVTMRMTTPEGYEFTAAAAVEATRRTASGEVSPGAWAPASALGKDFVTSMAGVRIETLTPARDRTHASGAVQARP